MEDNLQTVSWPVSADLSASQYCFTSIDSNGQLAVTGAGAQADGVLQDKPAAAARAGLLGIAGVSKVRAGGVVAAGDLITSDSTGRGVTATTGDNINGVAGEASTAANQVIKVLLKTQNANAVA